MHRALQPTAMMPPSICLRLHKSCTLVSSRGVRAARWVCRTAATRKWTAAATQGLNPLDPAGAVFGCHSMRYGVRGLRSGGQAPRRQLGRSFPRVSLLPSHAAHVKGFNLASRLRSSNCSLCEASPTRARPTPCLLARPLRRKTITQRPAPRCSSCSPPSLLPHPHSSMRALLPTAAAALLLLAALAAPSTVVAAPRRLLAKASSRPPVDNPPQFIVFT